jgi:SAM-dependent methyltransferase
MQERLLEDPEDVNAWQGLQESYAHMSDGWQEWTHQQPGYDAPVRAGLRTCQPAPWALEICCGTGEATAGITEAVTRVISCDVNESMLRQRPGTLSHVLWMQADVRALPFPDRSVPLVVSLNGVFNPGELRRVILNGGQLLWCTSFSDGTPLYVPPDDVVRLLGPGWSAVRGSTGIGEWTLLTAP